MKHGSNISHHNPNNSLNNRITLAHPPKKAKTALTAGKFMASFFFGANGILMVVDLQKDISRDWKVKVKYKSVSIYVLFE